jgi:putative secretion ATPase (PEP-CTERM system associated)
MYTRYFGFEDKPFSLVPNPFYLYLSSRHRLALNYLDYAIRDNVGFVLLTGEVGAGKTTLIRYLLNKIKKKMQVAVISNTNVSADELIKLILQELEVENISDHKSQNLDLLNTYLVQQYAQGKRVVLFVDEAQNLSREAMEEVRMLSNLSTDSKLLLQIILVGQPELRLAIQQSEFKQLAQRIAINYHLKGLENDEVGQYIKHRIQQAKGKNSDLFDPAAVELIYEYTEGTPRMINVICDACLVYAYADEEERISKEIVEQVIEDRGEEWGTNQQESGSTSEPLRANIDSTGGNLEASLNQIKQLVNRLELRVDALEKDRLNQDQSAKDEMMGWLEKRLEKSHEETKKYYFLSARKQKEVESLQGLVKELKESKEKLERQEGQMENEPEHWQGLPASPPVANAPKKSLRWKILFTTAAAGIVALVIHIYFGPML